MKLNTQTIQIQKTILAPMMQQSIQVLQLPASELSQLVEETLQENPLLEAVEKAIKDNSSSRTDKELQKTLERLSEFSYYKIHQQQSEDEEHDRDMMITRVMNLEEHLTRQLHCEESHPLRLKIGELIIGHLNDDGFLSIPLKEIARLAGLNNSELVREIHQLIQHFDPVGIASFNRTECLCIQADASDFKHSELAKIIIKNHFQHLAQKNYKAIANATQAKIKDIESAAEFISTLDPRPAANYRVNIGNIYIEPDVFVRKIDNTFKVETNQERIPKLRINQFYRRLLDKPNLNAQERKFIKDKLIHALNFIKSLALRGSTLVQITEYILEHQADFFQERNHAIRPMTLKDVAQTLERNESTISRAIYNKYMLTPLGMFPLKYFFTQTVFKDPKNKDVSCESIKDDIQSLLEEENKLNPLSDQALVNIFKKKGLNLARRTITKYRQALNIPSSHQRKQH